MNLQLSVAKILLLIVAILPIGHLYAWEGYTFFNTPLTHRIWITWSEIIIIAFTILILPVNITRDIKNNGKLCLILFTWIAIGFISTYFSENIYASLVRQIELCIHILFSYALLNVLSQSNYGRYLIFGLIGAFLYSLFYILLLRFAVGNLEYEWSTNIPFFSNIRHWGYLQIIALPLSYYLILRKEFKSAGLLIFTLIWTTIFWSGGRGSFLTAIIITVFIFPWLLKPRLNTYLTCLVCVGIALALALMAEVNHPSLSIKHLLFMKVDPAEGFNLNNYSAGRIEIYSESVKRVFNSSFLLGFGPDSFRYTTPPINIMATHPHDFAIQLLYANGIVGLLTVSLFFWFYFKKDKKQPTLENKTAKITLISAIIASVFDGVFYHSYSLYCLAIIFALFHHTGTPLKSNNVKRWQVFIPLLLSLPLIAIWTIHSKTYWQFQKPLSSISQLTIIEKFPSIILNKGWVNNSDNESLSIAALRLGGQYSDNQCWNFLTLEFTYKHDNKKQIYRHCDPSILSRRKESHYE